MFNRLVMIVALLGIASVGCGSKPSSGGGDVSSETRRKAPGFTLTDVNGRKLSLADLKGQVVFLDFWATWCPPCIVSSPEVEKLVEDYEGKKLAVLSVSLDQNPEALAAFLKGRDMKSRVARSADSGIEDLYGVSAIPSFFLIDQEGYVVTAWQGFNQAMPASWRKSLDRLLAA